MHELECKIGNERTSENPIRNELLNNWIFRGIKEQREDCEEKIKSFIRNVLDIDSEIEFDRAHRLGKKSTSHYRNSNKK